MSLFDFDKKDWKDFKDNDRCFQLMLHENELFTSRINLSLVAESLLFLSYVTTLTNIEIKNCISITIVILGLAVTILFGYVTIRHSYNLEKLKTAIDEIFPFHKKIRKKRLGIPTNIVLGWILAFVFISAWLVLLVINLCC